MSTTYPCPPANTDFCHLKEIFLVQTKHDEKVPGTWTKSGGTKVLGLILAHHYSLLNDSLLHRPLPVGLSQSSVLPYAA